MNLTLARSNMIEQQVRPWDVLDQRVLDVLAEVPREAFVEPERRGLAYSDFPLPIGHGQRMLKPVVDGRLLQALSPRVDERVLEIGTGSGYLTACLARLGAHCESLEIVPELAASAAARLAELGVANARVREQDAAAEWDMEARYDAIAFGGSLPEIPPRYRERLAVGGRLFAILGRADRPTMTAVLLTRVREDGWTTEQLFETRVEPLVNFAVADAPSFVF